LYEDHLAAIQANGTLSNGTQERSLTIVDPIYLAGLATMTNSGLYGVSYIDSCLDECKAGRNKESERSKSLESVHVRDYDNTSKDFAGGLESKN